MCVSYQRIGPTIDNWCSEHPIVAPRWAATYLSAHETQKRFRGAIRLLAQRLPIRQIDLRVIAHRDFVSICIHNDRELAEGEIDHAPVSAGVNQKKDVTLTILKSRHSGNDVR